MSGGFFDRIFDRCVTSAAGRWPDDLSEDMAQQWRAELAALRADRTIRPGLRLWHAMRFAVSLAVSPSVESENPGTGIWRERLSRLGTAVMATVGVLGVAMLARVLAGIASDGSAKGNLNQHFSTTVTNTIDVLAFIPAAAVLGWIGIVAARRSGIGRSQQPGVLATFIRIAPLGVAIWLVLSAPDGPTYGVGTYWDSIAVAVAVWAVLSAFTITAALRCTGAGRRAMAWLVAIVGSLIALELAGIAGGLRTAIGFRTGYGLAAGWFPLSFLPQDTVLFGYNFPGGPQSGTYYGYGSGALMYVVGLFAGPLLLCSAFVVAFAMRKARVTAPRPLPAPAAEAPARSAALVRWAAGAGAVIGIGAWAYLDGVGPLYSAESWGPDLYDGVWYRILAILLITASAVILLADRGPVMLPATALFTALFTADCVVNNSKWHGAPGALIVIAIGAAGLYGAWWLSAALRTERTTPDTARRALIGVAILACALIPTPPGLQDPCSCEPLPPTINVLNRVLPVVLWLLAITAALASRPTPLRRIATIAYVVIPPVVLIVPLAAHTPHVMFDPFFAPVALFFIQLPLMVTALAAARWRRTAAPIRALAGWLALGVVACAIAHPLVNLVAENGGLLAYPVVRIDHGNVDDPDTYSAGQLLLAIGLALIAARWRLPPSTATVAAAVTEPEVDPSELVVA